MATKALKLTDTDVTAIVDSLIEYECLPRGVTTRGACSLTALRPLMARYLEIRQSKHDELRARYKQEFAAYGPRFVGADAMRAADAMRGTIRELLISLGHFATVQRYSYECTNPGCNMTGGADGELAGQIFHVPCEGHRVGRGDTARKERES
jgi:hypothetical protein